MNFPANTFSFLPIWQGKPTLEFPGQWQCHSCRISYISIRIYSVSITGPHGRFSPVTGEICFLPSILGEWAWCLVFFNITMRHVILQLSFVPPLFHPEVEKSVDFIHIYILPTTWYVMRYIRLFNSYTLNICSL